MARFVRIRSPENDPAETLFDPEQVVFVEVGHPDPRSSGVTLTLSTGQKVPLTHEEWARLKPLIAREVTDV